jgi:hypothetical protein
MFRHDAASNPRRVESSCTLLQKPRHLVLINYVGLQAQAHDMLQTIVELQSPPMPSRTHFSEVFVLRDLAVALSACIYQSLCDSDTFSVKQQTDK